jgi:DNA-binding transcriptional MerR regulator
MIATEPQVAPVERLAFTIKEACQALGISRTALWRLEKRGLIKPSRALRTRLYPRAELLRFLEATR